MLSLLVLAATSSLIVAETPIYTQTDMNKALEETERNAIAKTANVIDALDDGDKDFDGEEVADETMALEEMMKNPEFQAALQNPEFQKMMEEMQKNPEMMDAALENVAEEAEEAAAEEAEETEALAELLTDADNDTDNAEDRDTDDAE